MFFCACLRGYLALIWKIRHAFPALLYAFTGRLNHSAATPLRNENDVYGAFVSLRGRGRIIRRGGWYNLFQLQPERGIKYRLRLCGGSCGVATPTYDACWDIWTNVWRGNLHTTTWRIPTCGPKMNEGPTCHARLFLLNRAKQFCVEKAHVSR